MVRWLSGIILGLLANLAISGRALANGDEVHFGEFHIPLTVIWLAGGVLTVVFLLFFISWRVSRRSAPRRAEERASRVEQAGEGGHDNQ